MHELSIALSIVEGAAEEASRHPEEHVEAVRLRLGRLSGVVKEALLFSYGLACEGTPLEGSRLEIDDVDAAVYCDRCSEESDVQDVRDMRCRHCGLPSNDVVRGREIRIVGLELRSEYAAAAG
jgi:hydrogenase nickel incorporation protein HypA/HybF